MNTFLKILLVVLVAVLAVKLLPLALASGCVMGVAMVVTAVLGLSAMTVIVGLGIVLAAVLSPIWLPILALVGVIVLIKRAHGSTA